MSEFVILKNADGLETVAIRKSTVQAIHLPDEGAGAVIVYPNGTCHAKNISLEQAFELFGVTEPPLVTRPPRRPQKKVK